MSNAYQSVDVCALRATRLDAAGVPEPGAHNVIVTDAITQVAYTTEIEQGTRTTQRNGCGGVCFTRETPDKVLGSNLTIDLCTLDPELVELIGAGDLLSDSGETVGWAIKGPDAMVGDGASVETWSLAYENDHQLIHPVTGAPAYLRRVWPRLFFAPTGNPTIAEGLHIRQFLGKGQSNPNFYDGPGNDIPLGYEGAYLEFLSAAPPTVSDGYATLAAS